MEILEEQKIVTISSEDKKRFEINTESELEYDIFINIISFYVSYINFVDTLKINLVKRDLDAKKVEEIINTQVTNVANSSYFYTITKIAVLEYFKKMSVLDLESFFMFNMKGFKEEVKVMVENYLSYKDAEEILNEDDELSETESAGINDIFETIRQHAIGTGVNLKDFNAIQVFGHGDNRLSYANKDGIQMDEDFFINTLGSSLKFEIKNDIKDVETLSDVLMCTCLLNILDSTSIVIHKTVSEKAREILLYNLSMFKKEHGKKFKIIICNGCDKCDK